MAFTDYDKCSLLLPMDGSNNGTTFTDWSPNPKTVTAAGNAKTVTAQSKYYGSSGYFDGTGDKLTLTSHVGFALGTGDFTLEFWFYNINGGHGETDARYVQIGPTGVKGSLSIYSPGSTIGTILVQAYSSEAVTIGAASAEITSGEWHHFALTRSSGSWKLFLDGVAFSTSSVTNNLLQNAVYVGGSNVTTTSYNGYIQDLLLVKGAALWTSDFTPPARLIGEISGNVKDVNGANAQRTIVAFPRTYPQKIFTTTSDGSTGNYTLRVPATEVSRIALADESTLYNDKVDRIIPE